LDIYLCENMRTNKVKLGILYPKKIILLFILIYNLNFQFFSQNTMVFDTIRISLEK
jgi:hypothetical protein